MVNSSGVQARAWEGLHRGALSDRLWTPRCAQSRSLTQVVEEKWKGVFSTVTDMRSFGQGRAPFEIFTTPPAKIEDADRDTDYFVFLKLSRYFFSYYFYILLHIDDAFNEIVGSTDHVICSLVSAQKHRVHLVNFMLSLENWPEN